MRLLALLLVLCGVQAWAAEPVKLPDNVFQVGLSGDENATAGNNAAHIVRDKTGMLHMVWVDSGRPGGPTGPVYRRVNSASDGSVKFETDPFYVAEKTPGEWNAYPGLTSTDDAVYLVWQAGGTARVRRLAIGPSGYTWGPIVDTGAKSMGRDVGPAIQADASGVRIVTPSGQFAISTDGGQTWKTEPVPLPQGQRIKTASLTADPAGGTILAFSSVVTDPQGGEGKERGSGGYWQLRTIRRSATGQWTDPQDVLGVFPGWAPPVGANDSLADWVRIASDSAGGLHLTWHGTGISHIYGNDQAYYAYKPAGGAWQEPIPLVKRNDNVGVKFSFAPSMTLDGELAITTVFYDIYEGARWAGFDADLVAFRRGQRVGPVLPLSTTVQQSVADHRPAEALSTRFPAAAPGLFTPRGTATLDVLETYIPMGIPDSPKLIVYHRVDVSKFLPP